MTSLCKFLIRQSNSFRPSASTGRADARRLTKPLCVMTSGTKLSSGSVRKPRYLILGNPVSEESGRKLCLPGIGDGVVHLLSASLGLAAFGLLESYRWMPAAAAGLLVVMCVHPVLRLSLGNFTGWVLDGTPAANASALASQMFVRGILLVVGLLGAAFWLLNT